MADMSGGDAVVGALASHGIDTLYCLPGVQSDHLFNAIFDADGAVKPIHTRHEQGAAYMALGAAMATGKPAAYSVVPGPGFLNSAAALSTAWAVNAKVVAMAGQNPVATIGKGFGLLHEIPDQLAIMAQLTKWSSRIESAADAPGKVAQAFQALNSGRARPVGLELPVNMLAGRTDTSPVAALPLDVPPQALPAELERAAELIAKAQRPIIYAGSGAILAADEVRQLAEKIGAPVVGHRMGRGILDARHPLSITQAAAHELWQTTDLAIGIASHMQLPLMTWGTDDNMQVIRIDIDPTELTKFAKMDLGINADSKAALAAINELLAGKAIDTQARLEALANRKQRFATEIAGLEPQLSFLRVIRDVLPENGILIDDLTQVGYVSRIAYPVYQPRTFLNSGFQGTLGWGVATALGAKNAVGDTPVVCISGDGGFGYNIQELSTAVRHGIGAVFIVFNDGAYGNVRRMQKEEHGNRVIASDLLNPDFVKLADSYGMAGHKVRTAEELRPVLEKAISGGEPTLIEVPIGEVPSPWGFIQLPKIRG
jgi:acetolactate synthase I/II/III large subunit